MTGKKKAVEIRWHGRGGQGAKSASVVLAEVLFENGKFAQAFPEYGAERQGAPMRAYNRVSGSPIRSRCGVQNPDIVVVVDPTMTENADFCDGCMDDATYLINTSEAPESLRKRLNISPKAKIFTVDATKITLEELGQNRPNAPLLGAMSRIFTDVPAHVFAEHFVSKMSQLSQGVLDSNRRAIMRGEKEAVLHE